MLRTKKMCNFAADMKLEIESEFARRVPGYRAAVIECDVAGGATTASQQQAMDSLVADIAARYAVGDINKRPAVAATRAAYKACGKDPNRYRPSQEQLMRRIVRGLGLYTVNSVVDAGNMLSLVTGCSVGCFDAGKVVGDCLKLGIGRAGEPYEGIGRGLLNIEGLPVFRDAVGGIGTPTSDNERTRIEDTTTRLLMTIHIFDSGADADGIVAEARRIFTEYCAADNFSATVCSPSE